jgi:hypothetical protein
MGFISDTLGNNVDISGLDPRSPDYITKIQELTTKIVSGDVKVNQSSNKVAPVANRTGYQPTQFEDDSVDDDSEVPSHVDTSTIPSSRKVKFIDDVGDEVEEEIDLSEDTKAIEIAKKLRRYNEVEEEIKALREETESLRKSRALQEAKVKKLLEVETKSSREKIDHFLEKEGGFEGLRKKIIEEYEELANLSPEEKVIRESLREKEESKRKMAELEKRLLDKEKAAEEKSKEAERAAKAATVKAVWRKYTIDNPSDNADIADLNKVILERAMTMVKGLESEGVTVTETILNREFKKASQGIKGLISQKSESKDKKITNVSDQLDASQAAAQGVQSSSSNAGRPSENAIMEKWKGLLKEGKGWAILNEVKQNPKLSSVYTKFANKLSSDRHWMNR